MNIDYYTEPVKEYQKGLTESKDVQELLAHIKKFQKVANDAYVKVGQAYFNFDEFKEGLLKERNKEYAGDEYAAKYGDVVFPMVMFQATVVATQFMVPWGLAYIRLKDVGRVKETRGIAYWIPPSEEDIAEEL
jgi:hypothetical protein